MYVDKVLSGIKAVQTLSRLNRAHPDKRDVFVPDFQNNTETITEAFSDYYRTTVLSDETDPASLAGCASRFTDTSRAKIENLRSDRAKPLLIPTYYLGQIPRD